MKKVSFLVFFLSVLLLSNCSTIKKYDKGFSESPETKYSESDKVSGISKDSVSLATAPSSVLLTAYPKYRLTTVYMLNFNKSDNNYFIGQNNFYKNYSQESYTNGNQWNENFMPGLQAVYGYNLVNVSLYNLDTKTQNNLFESPVLIKTLYYPSFSYDTLNYEPVKRDYYLISVYDNDTNNDGFINQKDLRRFYFFDLDGKNKSRLIPENYSVVSSEYDSANDFMYVFAQLDENKNGERDSKEQVNVFGIDLKNPRNNYKHY